MTDVNWADLLAQEDVEGLWNGLYQLISRHAAVRPLHFATDGAAVASQMEINADLTQELFIELFQKQRFEHYLRHDYTSAAIENELAYIEIPNMVGARLRKRYPESFRMARRVSALLKSSPRFRRLGGDAEEASPAEPESKPEAKPARRRGRPPKAKAAQAGERSEMQDARLVDDEDLDADDLPADEVDEKRGGQEAGQKRKRMVSQVFGLKEWGAAKPAGDSGHFADRIKSVPMRKRDTRIVGRSGSSQLILSNPELEELMVEVFKAIDSPADVRTLRQLVLSKIPLQDYNVSSLDEQVSMGNDGAALKRDPTDMRATPEVSLLREEQAEQVVRMAGEFLSTLRRAVNNNERRFSRLVETLWHCYYNPQSPSQMEIARLLGVSDSLVSDNRRLIEHELKKLKLTVEDGSVFSESLQRLVAPVDYRGAHTMH
ncbi:MAG TPA: hypothetical protein VE262_17305 [Blastocatellia bacterium]|nr:hypothetical protein [Blastocatellia bacterium]